MKIELSEFEWGVLFGFVAGLWVFYMIWVFILL